ncbi:MAG: PLP-dependent aminotransferase family protein [Roseibium sp.]|nr:PLP-dependent aminotransferase family protein [Roseibium sp.]MCV0426335.1 PLP-dependent aminotransferase family protein [Roseibium sp.]
MTDWCPDLTNSNSPRYIAIADSIEDDISAGRLGAGDRLPAQRQLASSLGLDFTTVARGYAEARRRGIISSQVGSGTFVTKPGDSEAAAQSRDPRRTCTPDFSMNLPPEPTDAALTAKMQEGFAALTSDLFPLLRYQTFETSELDSRAAVKWLESVGLSPSPEQVLYSPGAQSALINALVSFTYPGDKIACENITYPGIRSVCAQLNLNLLGLETDEGGILTEAFEKACRMQDIKALYVNPTLHNPTARTVPYQRRKDLAAIAQRFGIPILEDDAYGQLSNKAPLPFAAIAPDVTWYIGSLSKCLGAGLRLAYVLAPNKGMAWQFSRAVRTSQVMVSPLSIALATRWIEDGTASELRDRIRSESTARQIMATKRLAGHEFSSDSDGFHLWLTLPNDWSRSTFVSQTRSLQIGIVESDAFAVVGAAPEAVRISLGGPITREQLANSLDVVAHTLNASPQRASVYF